MKNETIAKKTYISQMPDKAGAFLEASKIISSVHANITRVSYNKAVDVHLLFIEVEADEKQHAYIYEKLNEIGYVLNDTPCSKIILIEFRLYDVPGAVLPILELINSFNFNISYISSQENDTDYQNFKMGIFVNDADDIKHFLEEAVKLCDVKIIDYDKSEKILDNTAFYLSFANQVANTLKLNKNETNLLIADSNLIMQILDERNESPYKTFSYIGKFADMIHKFKGVAFNAVIVKKKLKGAMELFSIEPPCGSNTHILRNNNSLLFIDCGFACYKSEMKKILLSLFPDFDVMEKKIIVSHPDIDHCGLLDLFDEVFVSESAYENFKLENEGRPNFREQNNLHAPYCRISKLLSGYRPPKMDSLHVIRRIQRQETTQPIQLAGEITFCGMQLDIYQGNGGHAKGEIVIVEEENHLVFSGDIVVNIAGFSKEQAEFNLLAPYLMTSVNMDSKEAMTERNYLMAKFKVEEYTYFCGHGTSLGSDVLRK